MALRKYISEFGLNMVGGPSALLQQDYLDSKELEKIFDEEHPCHVYMVCRRPRVIIRPDSVAFADGTFRGVVTIQDGPAIIDEPFSAPWSAGAECKFVSDYPYNSFEITDPNGELVFGGKTALIASGLGSDIVRHLDLEVLYVGQSYGEEGNRSAPERLQSHSTLQGIYAEALSRTPEKEIWIVLWSFSEVLLASFDGTQEVYGTSTEEDDEHINAVLATGVTEQQRINFTEGALIRYFDPEYNVLLRKTFPSPAHSTYSECYDLDVNSVVVELNTEQWNCMLWSKAAPPRWVHFAQFALHDRDERKAMFDVL
jgi:hypothetical protein